MLSTSDWRKLNEVALDLQSAHDLAQLPGRILAGMQKLFPFDGGSIQDDRGGTRNIPWFHGEEILWQPPDGEVDRSTRGLRMMAPWGPNFLPLREAFFEVSADRHPHTDYYRRTGDGAARRITDIVPMRQLRRTRFFNEISRPQGMQQQLTIYIQLPLAHTLILAAARQGIDFSERERMLLDLLRAHVAASWLRALPGGRKHAKPGSVSRKLGELPAPEKPGRVPLTVRESEILHWLAHGKRNSEIAVICGLATTTVETHLKNIFVKLGVETRTAAAAMAWEALNQNGRC
jgi:DNA-binding CsgD family transcriptional regulator